MSSAMDTPPIYLDYNATTPLDPAVCSAMLPYLQGRFGNPSSGHWYGLKEKQTVNESRQNVASLIGATAAEVVFTSGGTESVNWAIRGVAEAHGHRGKHIVTSKVEHVVVLECCKYLQAHFGFEVAYVDVDEWGRVSASEVEKAMRNDTILVTIMHANNETGSINPIKEIAAVAKRYGAIMHTDASQSIGKVPVEVDVLGVDLLTIAGHKLYAPAGIGALYIRAGTVVGKFMLGAGHEDGKRAGTENVMHMVALGTACALCRDLLKEGGGVPLLSLRETRDALHSLLLAAFPDLILNGHPEDRLPNTLNVSFPASSPSSYTLIQLTAQTVAFSAGSACHSGDECHISHVLAAMGADKQRASRACRFTTGRFTTMEQVEAAAAAIIKAAKTPIDQIPKSIPTSACAAGASCLPGTTPSACALRPAPAAGTSGGGVRLTALAHGGGCGCKIAPAVLTEILRRTAATTSIVPPELLVGLETSDDAAVYKLTDDLALVATTDFFMPVVDDPFDFGRIAAANAISDVYAMGGRPILALALLGMPMAALTPADVARILDGGQAVCAAAGIPVAGGHSIDTAEPIYGLVVLGLVHPSAVRRNTDLRPGDRIVLGKPLGVGVLSAALRMGRLDPAGYARLVASTTQLNTPGPDLAALPGVHGLTDVTGFGLAGHALEMARGAGPAVAVRIDWAAVPILDGARDLAAAGAITGASGRNWDGYGAEVSLVGPALTSDSAAASGAAEVERALLTDPQTSGGLLASCAPECVDEVLALFRRHGFAAAAAIGEVVRRADSGGPRLIVG